MAWRMPPREPEQAKRQVSAVALGRAKSSTSDERSMLKEAFDMAKCTKIRNVIPMRYNVV